MQSTGHARAHLSQPMQVVRSNRWKPRYRGRTGTGFSGYSKCCANALRRKDWTKYQSVTYMPLAMVLVARATFRSQVRIAGAGSQESGVRSRGTRAFYQPDRQRVPVMRLVCAMLCGITSDRMGRWFVSEARP